MASIRKRNSKYQVQVRNQGFQRSKTFFHLKDAQRWGKLMESRINLGQEFEVLDKTLLLSDLLNWYLQEVTPLKKGFDREVLRIKRLLREPISQRNVYQLKTTDFEEYTYLNKEFGVGRIAHTEDEWISHLEELSDQKLRNKERQRNMEIVREFHTMEKRGLEWDKVYKEIRDL